MKKNKREKLVLEKTLNVFAWISFFLALFVFIVTIFATISGDKNGKEVFGRKFLIVTSDSMSKSELSIDEKIFFNAGDLIVIKTNQDKTAFQVGDVITYISYSPESYGKTLSHKIKEIKRDFGGSVIGYVTYGINTGNIDSVSVKPENIIGVYARKIPKIGNLLSFLKTPRGYYISILTPAVLLIMFFSVKVGKTIGRRQTEKDYDKEIETLKNQVSSLSSNKETAVTTTNPIVTTTQTTATAQIKPVTTEKKVATTPTKKRDKSYYIKTFGKKN